MKSVNVTLPDSISFKEVEFEEMLSINVENLEILLGKRLRQHKVRTKCVYKIINLI